MIAACSTSFEEVHHALFAFRGRFPGRSGRGRGKGRTPRGPFPSPEEWREAPIYFLMIDRFNNPSAKPKHQPFDDPTEEVQGCVPCLTLDNRFCFR